MRFTGQTATRLLPALRARHLLTDQIEIPVLVASVGFESWDEIVELTAGTKNEDDATLGICIFQAEALEKKGMDDAALEVYRDALRSKKRNDELLKHARYGRGRLYLRLGKKAQGKKDLGRVYAAAPRSKLSRPLAQKVLVQGAS